LRSVADAKGSATRYSRAESCGSSILHGVDNDWSLNLGPNRVNVEMRDSAAALRTQEDGGMPAPPRRRAYWTMPKGAA
jgi:hypothetical protein